MRVEPVTLDGPTVRLEPLSDNHLQDLAEAANHPQIWTYLDEPEPPSMKQFIAEALDEQARGVRLPFAIMHKPTGKAIGSVSYLDICPGHHGLEIGWAWISPTHWSTGIAHEAAHLLIHHAFDTLDAIRVAFKTDARNHRSQRAIKALGAEYEGTLRNHRILHDGYVRNSVLYSITVPRDSGPPTSLA